MGVSGVKQLVLSVSLSVWGIANSLISSRCHQDQELAASGCLTLILSEDIAV